MAAARKHQWRLLLVEDDRDDYVLLRDLVGEIGTSCCLEWTPKYGAALQEMIRNRHHAYLVDYRLGEHDGVELMREAATRGCRNPMILLTGQGDLSVDLKAMEAGAVDYLEKGRLDAALLERSLRYAIERKRAEVTLAKRAQQLAKSNATVKEFADVASEDLQQPLETLAETLQQFQKQYEGKLDPDADASIARALKATETMKELIDELAMFSRAATED